MDTIRLAAEEFHVLLPPDAPMRQFQVMYEAASEQRKRRDSPS